MTNFNFLTKFEDWLGELSSRMSLVGVSYEVGDGEMSTSCIASNPYLTPIGHFRKVLVMSVLLVIVDVGNAWGTNWTKVSDLSAISNGDSVLVVIQDGKSLTVGKAFTTSGNTTANSADVTITSNSYISNPANTIKWAMTKSETTYTFKNGSNYITTGSATNANVNTGATSSSWYISKLSDGYFKVQLSSSSGRYLCWKGSCFGKYSDNFTNQITLATKVNLAQYHGALSFYKKESTSPTITKSSSFTTFTYSDGSPVSQSFTVGGSNLIGDVIVTAPTGYEVCKTAAGTYTASVSYTPSAGTLSNQTVYIRLQAGQSAGNIASRNISITSTDATTQTIAITGSIPYTITWTANGNVHATTYVAVGSTLALPGSNPTPNDCGCIGKAFYGWYGAGSSYANASVAPTIAKAGDAVSADKTYYAVFADAEDGSEMVTFGWESADDATNWTLSNLSAKGTYDTYKNSGSYAASNSSSTTAYIQYKSKISPTAISCKYTKETTNTNSSSLFKIQTSINGSSWTDQASGKTMDEVTKGTFETLSWSGSLTDVYVRIYLTTTATARVIDDVSITYGGTSYSNYATSCCTKLGQINGSINMTSSTDGTVTVKDWSEVSDASSYTVKLYQKNGESWDLVAGDAGTKTGITNRSTGATFSGLTYGATYKFTVTAIGTGSYCDGPETAVTSVNGNSLTNNEFLNKYSIYIDDGTNSDSGWGHHYIESLSSHTGNVTLNSLTAGATYKFKLTLGRVIWYSANATMTSSNCTNWTFYSNISENCGMTTGLGGNYIFAINAETPTVSVTYPSASQAADKIIYWDASIHGDAWSKLCFRVGTSSNNNARETAKNSSNLVPGTDQFYKMLTCYFGSMEAWTIANNTGWTGTNSVYRTDDEDDYTVTKSIAYQDYAVVDPITIIPTTSGSAGGSSENDGCTFYTLTKYDGMLTHTATITTPSNGTINIAYTDVNSAAQNKTATTAGLAHRTILTVTATPATGYQLSTLTINGGAHTSGDTYILAADATIAATFTAKTYDVTLDPDGGSGSNQTVEATYDADMPTTLKGDGDIVLPNKTGYTFGGYYSEKNGGGTQYYTSMGASARTWNIDGETTLYAKWTLNSHTLTWDWGGGACSGTAGTHYTAGGSVNYGTTINYPDESQMSKDGYDFTGWSTDVTSMPDANLTITAQWAIKHYTVTWLSNGSNYVTPVDYTHGAALALPAGTPSAPSGCSDKVFVGWTSDPEISTETSTKPTIISAGGAVTGGATYRAVFADRGGSGESNTYTRLETVSELYDGMKIVIVASQNSGAYLQQTASGITKYTSSIPKSTDEDITVTTSSLIWTLEAGTGVDAGKWRLLKDASNKLVAATTPSYTASGSTFSIEDDSREFIIYNGSCYGLEYYGTTPQWQFYSPSKCNIDYGVYGLWLYGQLYDNYITLCSTCTTPSDVAASGITTDGATITWNGTSQENNGGSGTGFVVKYGTNSTRDENSNTLNVAAGTNTADLTGLAQGTKYYVWVQSKCDNSWSTTPAEFTTLVSHTATFIGADGSTLQSSAIVEGESVTYSGSTPVSCDTGDGASTTFVGWATDTWTGKKAAKGNIPVGTTFYDVVGGGESLPNMGNSDVTYYAVFAKATGDPLEENTYTGSFSSKVFSSSNSTSATVSGVSWTLDAYHYDNEWNQVFCTDFSTGNNSRGQKVGSSSNWPAYMSLTTSGISGTITSVAVSTAGNSGVNATVAVSVGGNGWKLKNTNNYSASLTNSNTAYEFTGSGTGSISIDWAEDEENYTDALYFSQIVVAYTTGGDISYSNYMTTCSTCTTPSGVTASNITEASADITWSGVSSSGTTGFTIQWGTDGTRTNNDNTANTDANTKTKSLTGLEAGTTYYVWVSSRCDGTWSDRASFTTLAIHDVTFTNDNGTLSVVSPVGVVDGQTLTFPNVTSTSCGTFVGWKVTEVSDYDNVAAPSPLYKYNDTKENITADESYQAVYRTATGAETDVTDNVTIGVTGVTGNYADFTGATAYSSAVYIGNVKKDDTRIQMRNSSNSGIVTTTSGGLAKKVTFNWADSNTSGRIVDVYGKNTAYSSAADLYSADAAVQGTKIGSITYGTSTELTISTDYNYIGIRAKDGAAYASSIDIQWYGSPMHYMTSPTCNPMVGITESLSSFTYAYGAGPSASQSFTVSGSNLTNNVTVAAPANYEVCLTAAGTYSSSVSIAQVAGEIDNTTVYIRLKESLNVGSYNGGVVTVSSTGASDATSAALTGSVTKAAATMAFTPDVYEATYEGSPVIVNFMLTLNGDGTVAYSRSPANGSRAVNTDGENTFTALQAGIWTITATHTPGDNYTKAANATATVRVKCVDTYVDFIHNKAILAYGSGTPVTDGKMEDWGSGYTVPYVADESEATSGSCQTTHFKFVGWVSEDEINIVEGTFKPGYTLIPAGTAGKTASTKTYYAVWAKLED